MQLCLSNLKKFVQSTPGGLVPVGPKKVITIIYLFSAGIWIELNTLVIPGGYDNEGCLRGIAERIKGNLSNKTLIVRDGFSVVEKNLTEDSRCPGCHKDIPIIGKFGKITNFGKIYLPFQ